MINKLLVMGIFVGYMFPSQFVLAQDEDYDEDDFEDTELTKPGVVGEIGFFVEEFVPNRLKVEVNAADKRYTYNDPITVDILAEEMFGQPAADKSVSGFVRYSPEPFIAPQYKDYLFGDSELKFSSKTYDIEDGNLSKDGKFSVTIPSPTMRPPASLKASVQISVQDEGRTVTRRVTRHFDPVAYYLGIKSRTDSFVSVNEPADFDIIALDPSGTIKDTDSQLSASVSLVKWNSVLQQNGSEYSFVSNRQLEKVYSTDLTLSQGRANFTWKPDAEGAYLIHIQDKSTTASVSYNFYAGSGRWNNQPWSLEKPETIEMSLDKKSYSPGQNAKILIKSPFPGTLLITHEKDKVLSSAVYSMETNTMELDIPIGESLSPNFYLSASVIRPVKAASKWLPHRAMGQINVPVEPKERKLKINLDAPVEVKPNDTLEINLVVENSEATSPVESTLFVWAVDEGVISVTDFQTPNPFEFFYAARKLMIETADVFSNLMPDIISSAISRASTGGGDMFGVGKPSPIAGERIKPIVIWFGKTQTDKDGKATLSATVPNYIGRLKVMAIAANNNLFGNAETNVFVRSPLMVKEHLPRFAAPGDKFQSGFTIYNNTSQTLETNLSVNFDEHYIATKNVLENSLSLPALENKTIPVPIAIKENQIGNAGIEFKANSTSHDVFSSSISLPIRPPSPYITISGMERIRAGETKIITIPGTDFLADTTSATVVVTGFPIAEVLSGINYNLDYPYGCTEQIISKAFPFLNLSSLSQGRNAGRFSEDGIKHLVQETIDRVFLAQTYSGGLAMWSGSREPSYWVSLYGAHFLIEAKKQGYQIPEDYLNELIGYFKDFIPDNTASHEKQVMEAYKQYVLTLSGSPNRPAMEKLLENKSDLPTEAKSLLSSAFIRVGDNETAKSLLPQLQGLSLLSSRSGNKIYSSPARETAHLLLAYLDTDAGSPEVVKLVDRLIKMKTKNNHWGNTQDNAFAVWALGRYLEANKNQGPASGKVTLNNGESINFTTTEDVLLSSATLIGKDLSVVSEGGDSFVYWNITGIPLSPNTEAVSHGLQVSRRFVTRTGTPVDMNSIKQGDLIVVEVQFNEPQNLTNVAIEDLLPAGFEIENSNLASALKLDEYEEGENGVNLRRREIRDDRIIAFVDLFKTNQSQDPQIFKYVVRAVTAGEFILPPVKATSMYDPEIYGQSAAGKITVKPRQ